MKEITSVEIRANYLEYCQARVSFKGSHNRTKTLLLCMLGYRQQVNGGGLSIRQLYEYSNLERSYSSVRSTVSRLLKYNYIGQSAYGEYYLLSKGVRFVYLAQKSLNTNINAILAGTALRKLQYGADNLVLARMRRVGVLRRP